MVEGCTTDRRSRGSLRDDAARSSGEQSRKSNGSGPTPPQLVGCDEKRLDICSQRGAGEAVVLDSLNVAQQATDYLGTGPFQGKQASERFHSTLDAISTSLNVLEGPSRGNPSIQRAMQSLRRAKTIVDG